MNGTPELQEILYSVPAVNPNTGELKKCRDCGKEKPLSEFNKDKTKAGGLQAICRPCKRTADAEYYRKNSEKIQQNVKTYREENREAYLVNGKDYYQRHKNEFSVYGKTRYRNKREEIITRTKLYAEKNRPTILERKRKYHNDRKEEFAAKNRNKNNSACFSTHYINKLKGIEWAVLTSVGVIAKCKSCNSQFIPTLLQLKNRAACVYGKSQGEANLYCCDKCKQSCPVYNFYPHQQIDPRIAPPTSGKKQARKCQTKTLHQLQCDEVGHTYCEKCGDIFDVELHHTHEVAKFVTEAINPAGHILLCWRCHQEETKNCK